MAYYAGGSEACHDYSTATAVPKFPKCMNLIYLSSDGGVNGYIRVSSRLAWTNNSDFFNPRRNYPQLKLYQRYTFAFTLSFQPTWWLVTLV